MKKYINYIKDWLRLVKSVRELEGDVENLERKLLAPEEGKPSVNNWIWLSKVLYSWSEPTRKMSLEEKVNALASALGAKFEWIEEKKQLVAKLPRTKREKKGKYEN